VHAWLSRGRIQVEEDTNLNPLVIQMRSSGKTLKDQARPPRTQFAQERVLISTYFALLRMLLLILKLHESGVTVYQDLHLLIKSNPVLFRL
jgi:hypothetical protein